MMSESKNDNDFESFDEERQNAVSINARITAGGRFECEIQADSVDELENLIDFINTISFK